MASSFCSPTPSPLCTSHAASRQDAPSVPFIAASCPSSHPRLKARWICSSGRRHVAVPRASTKPLFSEVGTIPKDYHHYSDNLTVGDFMTTRLHTAKPTTSIQEALEMLVTYHITGLPVVDDEGVLVGVVSDYDLLAIDALLGSTDTSGGLFPKPDKSWKAFKEIQKLLLKTKGRVVGDVMTPHPLTVRASTNLDEAARMLLGSHFRRLPVLDEDGKLVGLLTRGNLVTAALQMMGAEEAKLKQVA